MRLTIATLAGVLTSIASSAPALAQSAAAPVADSSRCAVQPPVGSRVDTIGGRVAIEPEHALPESWAAMLLEGFREHLRPPAPLTVPVREGVQHVRARRDTVTLAIDGQVLATLRRDGTIENPRVSASTLSPELDARLVEAVRSLDSAHAIPPFPQDVAVDSVSVRFSVGAVGDSTVSSSPLFVAAQPTWILERPVWARPDNAFPRYPRKEERAGIGDTVFLAFDVDTDGTPIVETAQVLRARYQDFVTAVLDVLPKMRFQPARIAGCPVVAFVTMPFAFRNPF